MKKVSQVAMVVSKVLEILHWIGTAVMLVLLLCAVFAWKSLGMENLISVAGGGSVTFPLGYSLEIVPGGNATASVILCAVAAFFQMGLSAMIFRNIHLILKTTMGKTFFSKGKTPFQKDNVRMVRELGIFYIAGVVIGFILSIIGRIVIGSELAEVSINLAPLFTGIVLLCLSETFSYGAQLQRDVDGLV